MRIYYPFLGSELAQGNFPPRNAAYFIDPPDAAPAVRKVLRAQTQEEADEAVAQLWEESLEWYAPEERELLLRVLESMNEKA